MGSLCGNSNRATGCRSAGTSFVPSGAGLYRFALLIAVGGVISEPDEVTVLVGDASPSQGPRAMPPLDPRPGAAANVTLPPAPACAASPTAEQVLEMALPGLAEGKQVAAQVADVFESVVGAIYLDGGMTAVESFIVRFLDPEIDRVVRDAANNNYKSLLQQVAQREFGGTPRYQVLDEQGPDHHRSFKIAVIVNCVPVVFDTAHVRFVFTDVMGSGHCGARTSITFALR